MPQQQSIARFFGSLASTSQPKKSTPELSQSPAKSPRNSPKKSPKKSPAGLPKKPTLKTSIESSKRIAASDDDADEKVVKARKLGNRAAAQTLPESYSELEQKSPSAETTELKLEAEPEDAVSTEEAAKLIRLAQNQASQSITTSSNKLPYANLTQVLDKVGATSLRLEKTAICLQFFLDTLNQSTPDMLTKVLYLCINRLGPDYEPELELGLGETLLIKAIHECYGRSTANIKLDYKKLGDLGTVAQKSRLGQPTMFKPAPLDVEGVFENLSKIAKTKGSDAQNRKVGIIIKMLTACDANLSEAKFLIRLLEGKLRIGLAEQTVLVALAQAFVNYEHGKGQSAGKKVNPDELARAEEIFKEAFSQTPNYDMIIQHAYAHGWRNLLDHCKLTPGIPLKPMLAKPTKAILEVLDRFQGEEFTCEYKYDGERAQVHLLEDGLVRIYLRNLEDMSQRYPDLVAIMKELIATANVKLVVLDCEAVAWDRANDKILPFQVLSTRKRKDVKEGDIKVNICLFMFDMLFYGGEPLITKSLAERRKMMVDHLTPIPGKLQFASAKDSQSLDELQAFLDQLVKDLCEGLMVKMLHGTDLWYEPSKRLRNWLKLKKDYLAGVGDSLDLVVVGAYHGRGKRTGTYGGFLLALYNQDLGEYETTCKIGTGFSDEMLTELYTKLQPTEIEQPKSFYVYDTNNSNAKPDVWLEPTTVFEVLTADLSLLPVYKAAHTEYGKGISLRFPRFIRIRDDKGPEDATLSTQVAEFYERQASVQ